MNPLPVPEHLLLACMAATDSSVVITDAIAPDHPVVWVNPAFETTSGYRADQVLGRNLRLLQGPDTDPEATRTIRAALAAGQPARLRVLNHRPDGSRWWNEMQLSPVRDAAGVLTHYVGVQHDVTAQVSLEASAAFAATHDPLTGLANRPSFSAQLERELARSRRDRRALAVLFLDVDGFKQVNDTHGHATGDALLVAIATRLRDRLRGEDLVARLGGDEFLALIVDLAGDGTSAVATVTADLTASLAEPFDLEGVRHRITLSVGAAVHPRDGGGADELIAAADDAMYAAKAAIRPPAPD